MTTDSSAADLNQLGDSMTSVTLSPGGSTSSRSPSPVMDSPKESQPGVETPAQSGNVSPTDTTPCPSRTPSPALSASTLSSTTGSPHNGQSAAEQETQEPQEPATATWQEARLNLANLVSLEPIQISVHNPEEAGTFLKRYITYEVTVLPTNTSVRRRYTDFVWLRSALQIRFVGMRIPALPPKSSINGSTAEDSKFVQRRMRALQTFLEELARCPYMRSTEVFQSFLSTQSEAEWQACKEEADGVNMFQDTSVGCRQWQQDITARHDVPFTVDPNDVLKQLDQIERALKEISRRAAERVRRLQIEELECRNLRQTFQNLYNLEKDYDGRSVPVQVGSVRSFKGGEACSLWMEATTNFSETAAARASSEDDLLRGCLTFLTQEVVSMRELIHDREVAVKSMLRTQKRLDTFQAERNQGKTTTATESRLFGSPKDLDELLATVGKELNGKKMIVSYYSTALTWSEVDRFTKGRDEMLTRIHAELNS